MLKNIKSIYIVKIIFEYVNEKQKLKVVKLNKSLQNKIDLNIINYKLFTGRYIIFSSKRKGKEYNGNNGELVFKGEYLNGIRNGKGAEYYKDKILFEGNFLKGKRNGKGKEYDVDGLLMFEGEYLNGKRHGKGIGYDVWDGKFEGEYLNGKEWIGKKYKKSGELDYILKNNIKGIVLEHNNWNGKLIFEGEYLNGRKNGKGKEYYYNGKLSFEGEYLNDLKWNGKGYDKLNNIVYELKDGKGFVKEFSDFYPTNFEGEYLYGKRNGKGKEYDYNHKLVFEGEYLNDKRKKGKEYKEGKLIFDGEYLYEFRLKGKYYIKEILEFEGEYLYNKKWNGKGYDENGNIIYELINGNGKVKEYNDFEELEFEGEYLNGKRHGKGKEYWKNGELLFESEYLNGKRVKKLGDSCIFI